MFVESGIRTPVSAPCEMQVLRSPGERSASENSHACRLADVACAGCIIGSSAPWSGPYRALAARMSGPAITSWGARLGAGRRSWAHLAGAYADYADGERHVDGAVRGAMSSASDEDAGGTGESNHASGGRPGGAVAARIGALASGQRAGTVVAPCVVATGGESISCLRRLSSWGQPWRQATAA